jgi:NADPH:quinone reductase-like Zn-dependent oxidoreductase
MKAFVVEHYGNDGLRAADVPEPEVGDGDVLVKVSAAGINPLDKMVRNGEFKRLLKYQTPFVLGHDVAGVVTRVGSTVRDFQVGDEVYARPRDLRIGTFAEYIAIDQDDVAPKPASLTLHEAAAVPLVSLAWQALVNRAHVKPGQKVLVQAGSGGRGSTVIHSPSTSAPRWRRPPTATTRRWCAAAAPTSSWTTPTRTSPRSSPATTSCWTREGARTSRGPFPVLKPGGQAIGVTGPPDPGSQSRLFTQANGAQLRELASIYNAGHPRPLIDKTFQFDQTPEALAYVEQGRANGQGRHHARLTTPPAAQRLQWVRERKRMAAVADAVLDELRPSASSHPLLPLLGYAEVGPATLAPRPCGKGGRGRARSRAFACGSWRVCGRAS